MKASINKSELFKRAWKLYRIEGKARIIQIGCARIKETAKSFGWCLRKVWAELKNEIAWIVYKAAKAVEAAPTTPSAEVAAHNASMIHAFYNDIEARKDRYYTGD